MSQITLILDSIFKNNGGTTRQWRTANEILLTHTDEIKKYCSYMKNKIRDLNRDTQLLALDFLDFSIDDGKIPLWTQVGSKEFLNSLVNIYKTRNDEEVKNKVLYLIQKWNNKFKKYNTIIPNFNLTYDNLKENEVEFPENMESTYEKYLSSGNNTNPNDPNSHSSIYIRQLSNSGFTFTLTEDQASKLNMIYFYSGSDWTAGSGITTTFNNLMIYKGTDTKDYEPYLGGVPSPNINYPQEVNSVTNNINLSIVKKNLFDGKLEIGNISSTQGLNSTTTNAVRSVNYIPVKPDTVYSVVSHINTLRIDRLMLQNKH